MDSSPTKSSSKVDIFSVNTTVNTSGGNLEVTSSFKSVGPSNSNEDLQKPRKSIIKPPRSVSNNGAASKRERGGEHKSSRKSKGPRVSFSKNLVIVIPVENWKSFNRPSLAQENSCTCETF